LGLKRDRYATVLAAGLPAAAFTVPFGGLAAERWFLFAQADYPQSLFHEVIS
jgi:hypothetical protein